MLFDSVFIMALQSALVLGFIHGVNPCGHSWLVLAPFTYGAKSGKHVFSLTSGFILGTTIACITIGISLGSISLAIPASFKTFVNIGTAGILILLGLILIIKPHLLHSHDHEHEHGHSHSHSHEHHAHNHHDHHHHHAENCCGHHAPGDPACCNSQHDTKLKPLIIGNTAVAEEPAYTLGQPIGAVSTNQSNFTLGQTISQTKNEHGHSHHRGCGCSSSTKITKVTFWGLTVFGFINMIVPCPTVAIMYTYGLDSGSILKSTLVFLSYAIGTGLTLSAVIFAIYKATNALNALNKPWIEPLVMRTAGVLTIVFAVYSYLADTNMI
ncbi:urease accessory protein UreH domain-containing protein [Halodesulfovibrio marinisediminis]|uniref:Cytochrome C biogenesis protein transmembrane region n=1 Tax=Halodesulfovibrio marinisediminis DSM 17456 TaxID=1121457 RepID=A0A1N6H200_9BACT|nr:sulfite exporter TauE/SafE family protein [Halodesulfovibrio marinisediminis]SIO13722.1 Cytochrome C biogenesis protein transmembrane region [Halodesulfovibrio marinisediminis DSM 17456]